MDIDLLKTFLEVNKTRHFARAGENLFVTSAAVSARIKQLESQLGVTLFHRHRGNIQLTAEGERLLPHAENMLNAWLRTLQEVRLQPELDVRLHIGATPGLWMLAMDERLPCILERLPNVAIQAEGHANDELVRRVLDRHLDLVILYDPPSTTDLNSEKVGQLKLSLAATSEGESLDRGLTMPYVFVDWGRSFSEFHASKLGDSIKPRLHVNMTQIARTILKSSGGAAYFDQSTISREPWLHPVERAPSFSRPIWAAYRESNENLESIREIVTMISGFTI